MKAQITVPIFMAAIACSGSCLLAQEKREISIKTTAYQTSVSQEQLRATTRRLKGEMGVLLEEYAKYSAASAELKKLGEAMKELDVVTEEDMATVVRVLREASRSEQVEDAKAKLVEASSGQKEIQSLLRDIADRLTLQKEEAEIQRRLDELVLRQLANLRETKKLAESGDKPDKVQWQNRPTEQLARAEQEALKKEVEMAEDALKRLAEKSESPEKEAFEKLLETAAQNQIREKAENATAQLKSDFAEAAKSQEQLLENLKKMSQELQSRKDESERARDLAEKMQQLSEKQKQLAQELPQAWGDEKQKVRKQQEKISDQLEVAKKQLSQLNPEAAAKAEQAKAQSDETSQKIADRKSMEDVDQAAKVSDSQRDLATKLEEIGQMLEKQAEELAANESGDQQDSQQSSEAMAEQQRAEALANAVNQVMEAKNQMSVAKRQLDKGSDEADARKRLDEAQAMLEQAREQISDAGVPEKAAEELKKAVENIAKTEDGIGVGSKEDQEKSRWNLDRAQENANRALAEMRSAANQMAAEKGRQQGEKMQQAALSKQAQTSREDTNGPAGQSGDQKPEETNVSAVTEGGGGQREALQLLEQEKAPAEYETMVQQYIRNLAEAAGQE